MRFATLREWIGDNAVGGDFELTPVLPGPEYTKLNDWGWVITPTGGPGLNTDGLFDGRSVQVRSIGKQNNYQSAEDMALWIDFLFLRDAGSRKWGTLYVASVSRVGSPPTLLMEDEADRHHFVCDYTFDVHSGL